MKLPIVPWHAWCRIGIALTLQTATPAPARAQESDAASADTAPRVHFGGFVDGFYAWDIGRPPTRDRSFAGGTLFGTQPARHNEFNINLAFVEATLEGAQYRGRLALQLGTSVQANYAGEATTGQVSGPDVARHLQEAYGGVKLGRHSWVDAGIFASNMGMESFISRDNPTYTRSLVADYSPYFSTGVRVTHQVTSTLSARFDLVNGWQNISENNQGKGAGLRLDWMPAARVPGDATTLSYYGFASEESGTRTRLFNGIGASVTRGRLTLLGQADIGAQRRPAGDDGWSRWYGLLAVVRTRVTSAVSVSGRVERYEDPDQVIVATGSFTSGVVTRPNPAFDGVAASFGVDVQAAPGAVWRTEVRGFRNRAPVFPDGGGAPRRAGGFVVASLAVTF